MLPINLVGENAVCKELEKLTHKESAAAVAPALSPLQNQIVNLQKVYRAHMIKPKLKDLALATIRYHYIEARFNQALRVTISDQDRRLTNLQSLKQMASSLAECWENFDPIIRLKTQNAERFARTVERSVEHKS